VECAAVKYAVGRNKAVSADPDKAYEIIKNAACRAMSLIGRAKPYKPLLPMEVRLELYRSDYCDSYAGLPGVERIDARNVRKVVNSYKDMYFI